MTRLRVVLFGLPGAAVFLVCCAVVRGGLFDHRHYGDVDLYGGYAHRMTSGDWPYADFYDEYPPLAQPLFLVVRLLPGSFTSSFRWTMALCGAAALLLLVASLAVVRASLLTTAAAAAVAAFAPLAVGPVFLNTYDLFPALLTVAALYAFLRKGETAAFVLLALAVAAKVYAIVLLPLLLLDARRARRALAWFAGVLVLVHLPFAAVGPGGLRYSYWVQLKRGLEVESLAGGLLLVLDRLGLHQVTLRDEAPGSRDAVGSVADALAVLTTLVLVAAVVLVVWLYARRRRELLTASAAAVTAFVAFSKVLSPQYLTWLVPLVPAAGIAAGAVLMVALVLTRLEWDRFVLPHGSVDHWGHVLSWWILARDLVLVALYALLVVRLRAGPRRRSRP